MSHIVTITAQVHDPFAVAAACRRLGLAEPAQGTARLYSGEATGLLVQLPGWQYPVVIDTLTGVIGYDNYGGCWGDPAQLGRFLQAYLVARAKSEARRKSYAVSEQSFPDGRIKLTLTEGV
jgi:hypothetical protein